MIKNICFSLLKNLWMTIDYFFKKKKKSVPIQNEIYFQNEQRISTLQYPKKTMEVPPRGRYQLHNDIDNCIVCDKCVKICPVNCITIEAIPSPTLIGKTKDGKAKRIYPATFDIDMAKCCFCGLCTTVCPTHCLTMTSRYAYSTSNIHNHHFSFAKMKPESIQEKKKIWNDHQKKKQEEKKKQTTITIF